MKKINPKFKPCAAFIPYFYFGGAIFSLLILLNVKLLNDSDLFCHPISISIFLLVTVITIFTISYMWRMANKQDEKIVHWSFFQKLIVPLLVFIGMWILTSVILISFILFVNCIFDSSNSEIFDVEVVSVSRALRKAGAYLCAKIKRKNNSPDKIIRISYHSYRLLKDNKGSLRIYIKKGRLGYPWIYKDSVIE